MTLQGFADGKETRLAVIAWLQPQQNKKSLTEQIGGGKCLSWKDENQPGIEQLQTGIHIQQGLLLSSGRHWRRLSCLRIRIWGVCHCYPLKALVLWQVVELWKGTGALQP